MRHLLRMAALLCVCAATIWSAPVPRGTAEKVARNWMASVLHAEGKTLVVANTVAIPDDASPRLYACNLRPAGFVIVAADDISVPIIMYSADGYFDASLVPPAMKAMLETAQADIAAAANASLEAPPATSALWRDLTVPGGAHTATAASPVAPMLASVWNQTYPYNSLCPADPSGNGGHAFTGCTSLALAQLMRYHGWPSQGTGSFSYTHSKYGTLSANFASAAYGWSDMPDALSVNSSSREIDAVATLVYHCGVAIETNYGPNSSGAFLSRTRTALVSYFRYSPDARCIDRPDYSTSAWIGMLKDNIDHGRPVLYSGYDAGRSSGHAFVFDGHDGGDFFHVNWGWGGSYNGYFNVGDLTPGSMNFSSQCQAVIDIKPLGWLAQSAATTRSLLAVKAVSRDVVWICGAAGTVLLSTNSGSAWSAVSLPDTGIALCSIDAASATTAWIAGNRGVGGDAGVWKTTDAGMTWTKQLSSFQFGFNIRSIRMYDVSNGIALGDPIGGEFAIWTTSDGGGTWTPVPGDDIPDPISGEFTAGNGLCIAGNRAWFGTGERNTGAIRVYRSTNRGARWLSSGNVTGLGNTIVAAAFKTDSLGWALGSNGAVSKSTNAGLTWGSSLPSGVTTAGSIAYIAGDALAVTGGSGAFMISSDNGATWEAKYKPAVAAVLRALSFPSADVGWLVGDAGTIQKWIGLPFYVAAPDIPVPSSPADAAIDVPAAPVLSWLASARAETYALQVATDPGFLALVLEKENLRGTSYALSGLSLKTAYHWRVRARNSGGISEWSQVRSFTTVGSLPLPPALAAPAKWSTGVPVQPRLSWKPAAEATGYRLHVFQLEAGLETTVLDQGGITDTSYQMSALANDTVYYWEVKAVNTGGESFWSETWNFRTVIAAPTVPLLIAPAQRSTGVPVTPILEWSGGDRAAAFHVQLALDVSFTDIRYENDSLTAPPHAVPPLAFGTQYFWRMRSKNAGGISAWTPIWYFITAQEPPQAPLLRTPPDGSTGMPLSLRLEWDSASGATSYQLQVAADTAFQLRLVDSSKLGATNATVSGLTYDRDYFWRARAVNDGGPGQWSTVWSFRTRSAPPPIPLLDAPSDNAVDVDTALTLSWRAADGATSYRLQLARTADFAAPVLDTAGLPGLSYAVNSLLTETMYFWRVDASNSSGSSGWSAASRFTTRRSLLGIGHIADGAPVAFELCQNYPNPVPATTARTTIRYRIPAPGHVTLTVFAIDGKRLSAFDEGVRAAGEYEIDVATDDLPSGRYLYTIRIGATALSRAMTIVR